MGKQELTLEEQLDLISQAWGKQKGFCFFPYMSGTAADKRERAMSYREGKAFRWPRDRSKILDHMHAHINDDLFWCPNLFEWPRRDSDGAKDQHSLWADLDEVDPHTIDERYRPTIAWETSPGRFQALWIMRPGYYLRGASHPGFENQRLTRYLGADVSGWDATQLLRIPGWANHKPERRAEYGGPPQGHLVMKYRPIYTTKSFEELPTVEVLGRVGEVVLEEQLDSIDAKQLWHNIRLKLKPHIREFFMAKAAHGDRSDVLWQMERELADLGMTIAQIVALVRPTVWNKFADRPNELSQLSTEAAKAIDARPDEGIEVIAEERDWSPQRLEVFFANLLPPEWLIQDIWTEGSCGFIAGQPKSFKSWFALDMALAIATGHDFLDYFQVVKPGPVLFIEEEDSAALMKSRYQTMMGTARTSVEEEDDGIILTPRALRPSDPDVDLLIRAGFRLTDEGWMERLDRHLFEKEYRALIVDPLMMVMGEVEENRASEMTDKIFRPLKQLSEKYNLAVIVVHHMKKGDGAGQRGGQMMLGSVANHAWSESSLYVTHSHGNLHIEVESKQAQGGSFEVSKIRNRRWTPTITNDKLGRDDQPPERVEIRQVTDNGALPKVVQWMKDNDKVRLTPSEYAVYQKISRQSAKNQLDRAVRKGHLTHSGIAYALDT